MTSTASAPTTDEGRRASSAWNHQHVLDLDDFTVPEIESVLHLADRMREVLDRRIARMPALRGYTVVNLFYEPSTRTRVSFEVGVHQMGGETIVLKGDEMQLGHGETIADTARVLSRYVDLIMIRTFEEATLLELAEYATVPVINGLTNASHPCQIMADVMTFEEHRGPVAGRTLAWVGDGNNVAASFIHAAPLLGFRLNIATPAQFAPDPADLARAEARGAQIKTTDDPRAAVRARTALSKASEAGAAILMSTHLLGIAERLCQRILIMDQGLLKADVSGPELESLLAKGAGAVEELYLSLVSEPEEKL